MKLLSRRDIVSALITGLTTGVIAWGIISYFGAPLPLGLGFGGILVALLPMLWLAGVQLGYVLGMFFPPFTQFGRFVAIGFANAMVDFGILYLLISQTGVAEGLAFSAFKTFSFMVATVHSYIWNKYWAFEAGSSRGGTREAASFFSVALTALLVNVGVASLVVALRPAGIETQVWAGVGAIAGSATALILSFVGFRIFVFKK
jgi:putative flippase GtrA